MPMVRTACQRPSADDQPMPPSPGADTPAASTVELVVRARLGDEGAWREIMARYEGPLRRSVRGRLPRAARGLNDTDDMVQDATLNVLRRLPLIELRFPGALLAYLRRSINNRLVDERRRAQRTVIPTPLLDEHVTPQASPLDHILARDRRRRFRAGLSTLSARDRRAVVMRLEAGASYEVIATALGCPTPNAARVTVGRALHRLAEHMATAPAAAPAPAVGRPRAPRRD
jgi:RNA polymerase sigma factor (sigma-70 family)